MEHIKELEMYIKKYGDDQIFEFDSLDELRNFDESYREDTRSPILKDVAERLNLKEQDLTDLAPLPGRGENLKDLLSGRRMESISIFTKTAG